VPNHRSLADAIAGAVSIVALLTLGGAPARAVDGVIEINQAAVVASGGFPFTISAAGSYRLTSNLTGGISITDDDVTLDLNGFAIDCSTGCTGISSSSSNVTVRDGSLRKASLTLSGAHARVERVRAIGEGQLSGDLLVLGSDCSIRDSMATGAGESGIAVSDRCLVSGNESNTNGEQGINAGSGSTLIENVANGNGFFGIGVGGGSSGGCVMSGNVASNNPVRGISAEDCTVVRNVANGNGVGIQATNATVIGNVANGNSSEGLVAIGPTGYGSNQFDDNNGGNANPQVTGGIEIDTNVCGGDTTCP
jgi:hypothetical protein